MAQVYALKLDEEINETPFRLLSTKISKEKKERVETFYRREDALRTLFSELLLRYILRKFVGLQNETISFLYSDYGKPSLKNFPQLHFNLSHSGEWIVCATDTHPIGIDIEQIQPIDLSIAEHYFSEKEKQQLFSLPPWAQLSFFFELWTLKESFIKQKGKGLSIPLNSFTVSLTPEQPITLEENGNRLPLFFKQYQPDNAYKMAVCGRNDSFGDIGIIPLTSLIHYFIAEAP